MVEEPPISCIQWKPSWRLVPSRFPPISLFDRVADPHYLEAVIAIESITNARIREEVGELERVPHDERQSGPGTTPIMASFTHINPEGSRFTDGNFGAYYAANSIETALEETKYHRERFLARTNESAMEIDMRSYASDIECELHDIRQAKLEWQKYYYPNSYSSSQMLARQLRHEASNGIVYNSVRREGGECVAIFKANIPSPVVQGSHYCYCWDGQNISNIYTKSSL